MKCYGQVDGRRPWPPEGVVRQGVRGSSPEFFCKTLLGTFHSVPSSAKSLQIISALTNIEFSALI